MAGSTLQKYKGKVVVVTPTPDHDTNNCWIGRLAAFDSQYICLKSALEEEYVDPCVEFNKDDVKGLKSDLRSSKLELLVSYSSIKTIRLHPYLAPKKKN